MTLASRLEQSTFRERQRFVIDAGERVSRATVERECDAFWTYGVELETADNRGRFWRVVADEGFGAAVESESPEDWIASVQERLSPPWLLEVRGAA